MSFTPIQYREAALAQDEAPMIHALPGASGIAYCCGVELANYFHELRDPIEQRPRVRG